MSDEFKEWIEKFDETYYDLEHHERAYFLRHVLRIWRDQLQATIKDRAKGAEKERVLRLIQSVDEQIADVESMVPPPEGGW